MLAIIPARSGSKRIPNKNIKSFLGKPIISYAIETARSSRLFNEILVSTDSKEIAAIATEYGAYVPKLRCNDLADDNTPTVSVIRYTLEMFYEQMNDSDLVCCIYPCTPLLQDKYLIKAAEKLMQIKGLESYVFPVVEFPSAPQRALQIQPSGEAISMYSEYSQIRTQDLNPLFYDAGQFYFGSKSCWLTNNNIHSNSYPLIISRTSAVDIDTPDDWELAELWYQVVNRTLK